MEDLTKEQVELTLKKIESMSQLEMCRLWRFAPKGTELYFKKDTVIGDAFNDRLWKHFKGFTPSISKKLGWQ